VRERVRERERERESERESVCAWRHCTVMACSSHGQIETNSDTRPRDCICDRDRGRERSDSRFELAVTLVLCCHGSTRGLALSAKVFGLSTLIAHREYTRVRKRWLPLRYLLLSSLDSPSLFVVKRLVRTIVKREPFTNFGFANGYQLGAVHSILFVRSFEFTVRIFVVVVRKMAKERTPRIECLLRVQVLVAEEHNEPAILEQTHASTNEGAVALVLAAAISSFGGVVARGSLHRRMAHVKPPQVFRPQSTGVIVVV
jgi:hypothetical protein